ncbi:MAG TPA: nitroreductase family protein [Vicinamibacterales bacterium]|nr:nitroreductase family protein [Vicinamibacterales bacterium]
MSTKQIERPLSALDAIYTRRSVRSYTTEVLDRPTVQALLDAAVQAPTAMLEQPWLFVVVQDRRVLRELSDLAKTLWIREPVLRPSIHHAEESTPPAAIAARLADPSFNIFYDATTLVVICARRTDGFVSADCWLAAENLMLAASALGLGTCCIGGALPALNAPEGKLALGIPPDVFAIAPIVIGVPAGSVHPVPRRDPEILGWK